MFRVCQERRETLKYRNKSITCVCLVSLLKSPFSVPLYLMQAQNACPRYLKVVIIYFVLILTGRSKNKYEMFVSIYV
jgi:hypothetical protein